MNIKRIILSFVLCASVANAIACTNFIVGKKASADGSVMCTYNADDYGAYMPLYHYSAAKHAKGEVRKIFDWDSGVYHGEIPEASETYNVIGNINEYQVTIGETTFGGREEMVDSTGIIDYGSLIYIALQRSKTAREAISIMTSLVEKYGYCSEGETFTICDPNEAWIMEMMGQGAGSKKVVWVAVRIPDDAICAHANQSRIRTFNQSDKQNVLYSKDCIKFARKMGWFNGKDKDFSFCDVYAAADFSGRRFCEARVWSFFNHFGDMSKYIDYAAGKVADAEPMPLWIIPNKKVSLQDLQVCMRDHYEGTPFALDNDMGQGIWEMPYRPTPLTFKVDGKTCFNERPTSTQQTAFSFISQMRSWLPRQIGGVLWFGNDDGNMIAYTPIYCANTETPVCYDDPNADATKFSYNSAFWVCNWVSNMVYPRYSLMFPTLKELRDSLETSYINNQARIEKKAVEKYGSNNEELVSYLTNYSNTLAQNMLKEWKDLAIRLIVKYNDMAVKTEKNGKFELTPTGKCAPVKRPGYPQKVARELINQTGEKYVVPE